MTLFKLKWENMGWINMAESVASFPWPGLPEDVHFSVSYAPNTDEMNLHLSRNLPGLPSGDKPRIRIAQWPKAEAEEMARLLFIRYWQQFWEPFDMPKFQYRRSAKGQAARYCSISRLLKPGGRHVIQRRLKSELLTHLTRKRNGRELILREELIPSLERLMLQPDFFWTMVDQFKRVPRQFTGPMEMGLLRTRDFSGIVVRLQGQWFTFRRAVDWVSLFRSFFEPEVFEALQQKLAEAIRVISEATTGEDTRSFHAPFNLTIICPDR
ncbi:hypothetical protein Q4E93_33515 [Flavitalea sp. BT771]|uniref:hypothetical protein n=1 Tax=Flavitalea sp. BT771 TaxID=3063329 RepID=UPI0026E17173|nr:hypothetical protein [Flavitalea sp. BT771]MDO6435581.1 hypothetical protein [Flavitalea sp. BT771]MDV6224481.1 hypothetical protein [Flavitalea sp. BT771]